MKPPGTYKLTGRPRAEAAGLPSVGHSDLGELIHAIARGDGRAQRIVASLRHDITNCDGAQTLRIRQVFSDPRPVYRVELENPDLSYQRTTLLDEEALDELMELDEVRHLLSNPSA